MYKHYYQKEHVLLLCNVTTVCSLHLQTTLSLQEKFTGWRMGLQQSIRLPKENQNSGTLQTYEAIFL